jgi:WG repeat protein
MWVYRQSLVSLCGLVLLTTALTGLARAEYKCGYIDKTGMVVIPLQFSSARGFREGLAAVRTEKDGKWGFIDRTGTVVIPLQFEVDVHRG